MALLATVLIAALDLGALFSEKDAWSGKAEFFAVEHAKEGFVFASERRDVVNCLKHDTCTWHGMRVWETRVFFDKGGEEERISRVELSLYNRGDAGLALMEVPELKAAIADVSKRLDPGAKWANPEKTTLRNGSVRYRRVFAKADPAAELVWGLSAPGAKGAREVEYLRLTLSPCQPAAQSAPRASTSARKPAGAAGKAKIRDNVTKSPNGDVFIDNVPMVDQGQKGYCAAAVAERVLRYYGNVVDEHEIAQQAGTRAQGGTSTAEMKKAVTAIGEKRGLGYQEIVSMSAGLGDLEDEVARYNKAAKSEKKPPLSIADFTRGNVIYVSEMRAAMDKKVVYRMRQKDPRMKKFLAGVRQQVNAGIPVFWGVTLGIFPERGVNPQSTGGHMRLIIGYNDKKKEVLFTDTWGEGHELKRMPEDWAFAITHDAFFLKPR
ncbi:MAG: C39 family peptidase [Kiritimatiellae bacterium]|nr:C39 family peptidase [Kiritimatiellia bacterium]